MSRIYDLPHLDAQRTWKGGRKALSMAGSKQKPTVLLLIGKTGNGKSASGNTILGNRTFTSNGNTHSETKIIGHDVVEFDNRYIKVIDTPGFADTKCDELEGLHLITSQMEQVLLVCPTGIHACLIVLRYGNRFTGEEKKTIKHIQEIFGESFLRKYCIILMTNGDSFLHEREESQDNLKFEQWAENQEGDFKDLYHGCEKKIILFDNRKKGIDKINQVRELLKMVDLLGGKKYKDKNFEKAKKAREAMILSSNLPFIREETMTEVSLILQELNKISKLDTNAVTTEELIKLKLRTEELLTKLVEQDNKTGILNGLIDQVKSLVANVSEEIRVRDRLKLEIQMHGSGFDNQVLNSFLLKLVMEKCILINMLQSQYKDMQDNNAKVLKEESSCIVM